MKRAILLAAVMVIAAAAMAQTAADDPRNQAGYSRFSDGNKVKRLEPYVDVLQAELFAARKEIAELKKLLPPTAGVPAVARRHVPLDGLSLEIGQSGIIDAARIETILGDSEALMVANIPGIRGDYAVDHKVTFVVRGVPFKGRAAGYIYRVPAPRHVGDEPDTSLPAMMVTGTTAIGGLTYYVFEPVALVH